MTTPTTERVILLGMDGLSPPILERLNGEFQIRSLPQMAPPSQ